MTDIPTGEAYILWTITKKMISSFIIHVEIVHWVSLVAKASGYMDSARFKMCISAAPHKECLRFGFDLCVSTVNVDSSNIISAILKVF